MNTKTFILHSTSILIKNPENIKYIVKESVFVIVWALLFKNFKIHFDQLLESMYSLKRKILIYMYTVLYAFIYSV